jgi:GDPmannose 4,6-dehydratase
MPRTALITGLTGQDGSYLSEFLLGKGYRVYGLVRRLSVPNTTNIEGVLDRVEIVDGDLADFGSIVQALSAVQPSEIYHLAAQSFVGTSFSQPTYTGDVSGLAVTRLLEAAKVVCPQARIYNASSSEIFGPNSGVGALNESSPFNPVSPYAVAKLYGYYMARIYREAYGMFVASGILFNHESPRRGKEFVTRKISLGVARISRGLQKHITLGNLRARRDWGYAPEYVEAMWLVLQHRKPDDFIIATGETHSVGEFARLACETAGIKQWEDKIKIDKRLLRPSDVPSLRGDASKAARVLGWKPKTTFKGLVKLMVEADLKAVEKGVTSAADTD